MSGIVMIHTLFILFQIGIIFNRANSIIFKQKVTLFEILLTYMNCIFFLVKFQSWTLAQDTLFKPVITATKMFIKRSFNSIGDSLKMSRWFFGITSYGDARWGRSLMHSNSIKCSNRSSCEDVPRVPLFLPTKNIVLKKKLFSFSLSYFDYLRHLRFF